MNFQREIRWVKQYLLFMITTIILGLAVIGAGFLLGGITLAYVLLLENASVRVLVIEAGPGIALQLLGGLIWLIGGVAVLYWALFGRMSEAINQGLGNTEIESSLEHVVSERVGDLETEFAELRRLLKERE